MKEDGSSGEEGSISHNGKGVGDIQDGKGKSGGKGVTKGVESFLLDEVQFHG